MLGSIVVVLDPIFSGLAWSFIFGIFASTAFSLVVVPGDVGVGETGVTRDAQQSCGRQRTLARA
jgi:hypothetical protein